MKLIKAVLWTVFGVVIGATAGLTASRVQAQPQPTAERILITPAAGATSGGNSYGMFFVKDNKSGGCWIAHKDSGVINALAVAPVSACY